MAALSAMDYWPKEPSDILGRWLAEEYTFAKKLCWIKKMFRKVLKRFARTSRSHVKLVVKLERKPKIVKLQQKEFFGS